MAILTLFQYMIEAGHYNSVQNSWDFENLFEKMTFSYIHKNYDNNPPFPQNNFGIFSGVSSDMQDHFLTKREKHFFSSLPPVVCLSVRMSVFLSVWLFGVCLMYV